MSNSNAISRTICHLTLPRLAKEQTEEFLTPKQAAGYLHVSKSYLDKLASLWGRPKFLRFGRKILYRKSELNLWAAERSFQFDQRVPEQQSNNRISILHLPKTSAG